MDADGLFRLFEPFIVMAIIMLAMAEPEKKIRQRIADRRARRSRR